MSNLRSVPVTEYPMFEATTSVQLLDRLRRIRRQGVPGLVVRASGLLDIGATSHEDVASALTNILLENPELGWRPTGRPKKLPLGGASRGPGEFHHDARNDLGVKFRIQKTRKGQGKVWLANGLVAGPEYYSLEEEADHYFRQGKVDPRIIAPNVYTADVEPDDNVIFPNQLAPNDLNDIVGPTWHRFDTSSIVREADVITIDVEY